MTTTLHWRPLLTATVIAALVGCASVPPTENIEGADRRDADSLLVVDCLLPGQIRRLGTRLTYLTPRRPVKTAASVCEIRGGEYVAYDRSNFATALKIWLPKAEDGDPQAQTYVGEIYEKGLGVNADYQLARQWYTRAAEQEYSRALINLGYLYEAGLGVSRDLARAMNLYRDASGLTDGDLEYVSSVEYAEREAAEQQTVALQEQVATLQASLADSEIRYRQQQESLRNDQASLDTLRQQVENQRRIVAAQAAEDADNASTAAAQLQRIESLESALGAARTEQLRLGDQLAAQQLETTALRQQYVLTNRELSERENELSEREATIQRLLEQSEINEDTRASLEPQLKAARQEATALQTDIERLRLSNSEADAELAERLRAAEVREQQLAQEADQQADRIAGLNAQRDQERVRYEVEIASLQESLEGTRSEQQRLADELADARVATAESERDRERLALALAEEQDRASDREAEQQRLTEKLTEAELARNTAELENRQMRESLDSQEKLVATREAEQQRLTDQLIALQLSEKSTESQRLALQAELETSNDRLATARAEQLRLTDRLRDAELQTIIRNKRDELIISGLDRALSDSLEQLQERNLQLSTLENELAQTRTQLAAAPDLAEQARLEGRLNQQSLALDEARSEQQRLTDRLLGQQLASRSQQRDAEQQLASLEQQLASREALVAEQRTRLAQLESDVSQTRVQLVANDADRITPILAVGPSIDIIDPPLLATRGTPVVTRRSGQSLELVGKVEPAADVLTFKINGTTQVLNGAGVFQYTHSDTEGALELVAIDNSGTSTRLQLEIAGATQAPSAGSSGSSTATATRTPPPASKARVSLDGIEFGRYYALIIGNNEYDTLTDLNTAENDARTVDRIFREQYGFQTELLINATRYDMLAALNRMRETLTARDNLVIYYAGHGELDRNNRRGYWMPVDADPANQDNWISNAAITNQIDAMKAKHVLVIADSCYSGTLTSTSVARQQPDMKPDIQRRWYSAIARSKVRSVLSSGGVKPVFDGEPGSQHSVFARVFIDELQRNNDVLETYSLFYNVQRRVTEAALALNVDQSPQYDPIRHAGHEAGEFLFVPVSRRTASRL